jgi:enediyne biosynthesis protein E4
MKKPVTAEWTCLVESVKRESLAAQKPAHNDPLRRIFRWISSRRRHVPKTCRRRTPIRLLEYVLMLRLGTVLLAVALSAGCSAQVVSGAGVFANSAPKAASGVTAQNSRGSDGSAKAAMHFREISAEAGLTTVPHTRTDRRYVLDTMSAGGVALLDCDNDGKLDVAVVNDSTIDQYLKGGDPMLTLYHQDSNSARLHFTDITTKAGLTTKGWGMAIAVGDYDNDGLPDIYVTGYEHNVLYHNIGDCRFEDVTEKAGVIGGGFSTGAAWADYDRDGKLDLFVARYVRTDARHLPDPKLSFGYKGVLVELPDRMEGETDLLYHNRGDGTFEEVSKKAGVDDPRKLHGMGVVWGDYDGDGWPDLIVTNDSGWNYLYHNKHDGTFEDLGVATGIGLGPFGEPYGNMAADFGDYDRDGKFDILVSRFGSQPASLYRNRGQEFPDIAERAKIAKPTFSPVKWGIGFGDFDNDGWPDFLMANGNFSSLMDTLPGEVRFAEPVQLFRNLGDRTFEDVADPAGLNQGALKSRRGTAFGDINNDGNLDVVIFNVGEPPSLFINETANFNHRVLFRLIGSKSNRAAIGARVSVTTSTMTQIDEVRAGGSYNSTNDWRLHFGLGSEATMTKVEVSWPSGAKQEFQNLPADKIYEIREGEAPKTTVTLPNPQPTGAVK